MRKLSLIVTACAGVLLGACTVTSATVGTSGPGTTKVAAVDRDFELSVGQSAKVDGTALTIAFNGVTEESRCPVGVQCVWAGNAAVALSLTDGSGAKTEASVSTTLTPHSARVSGYEISLVGVNPYPKQGMTIQQVSYVVTLHVTRL
jgi:hypothetical protein